MKKLKPSKEYVMARNIAAVKDDATRQKMLAKVPPGKRGRVQELVGLSDLLKQ